MYSKIGGPTLKVSNRSCYDPLDDVPWSVRQKLEEAKTAQTGERRQTGQEKRELQRKARQK